MNEVIASILEAEKRSEEIIKEAQAKAKELKLEADLKGEKMKNNAVALYKVHRSALLADAEKQADAAYAEILAAGERAAEELKAKANEKKDAVAREIAERIVK